MSCDVRAILSTKNNVSHQNVNHIQSPYFNVNKIIDNNNPDNLRDRRRRKFYYSPNISCLIPYLFWLLLK